MSSKVGPGAREAVFAQLSDTGRAQQVAQRLADGIALGVLAAGERLPSEPELARRFGVAVITVREGLGILRDAGLLQTRRGRDGGSFIAADEDDGHHGILTARLHGLSHVEIDDIGVYFAAIAAAAAERSADRAAAPDAARLSSWLADAGFADAGAARSTQSGLFLELAVLSQSPRLVREQIRLQADLGPLLLSALASPAVRRDALTQDRRIVQAIADRRPARARDAAGAVVALLTAQVLATKLLREGGTGDEEPLSA